MSRAYSIKERLERSFECVRFIESLGVGKSKLLKALNSTNGGLIQKTKNDSSVNDRKYAKYIGEWADGDALAANYGYGIDYFCTNDEASSVGSSSIFHATTLQKLEANYSVNVVSPEELLHVLGFTNI